MIKTVFHSESEQLMSCNTTTTTTTTIFIHAQKLFSIDLNTRKKNNKGRAQPLRNSSANRAKWLGQAERNLKMHFYLTH